MYVITSENTVDLITTEIIIIIIIIIIIHSAVQKF
jgi:hypothetical protein